MYEPTPTDPRNLSFEQEATDPANTQAEKDYYDALTLDDARAQLKQAHELVAGLEQLLDLFAPRWREWAERE